MGEMADYYMDRDFDYHHKLPKDKDDEIENYKYWTQKDGSKVKIKSMTTSYLSNSIALIIRKENWRQNWLKPLEKELKKRNNMAEHP